MVIDSNHASHDLHIQAAFVCSLRVLRTVTVCGMADQFEPMKELLETSVPKKYRKQKNGPYTDFLVKYYLHVRRSILHIASIHKREKKASIEHTMP